MKAESSLTFLVVENHPDTLDAIRAFLEMQGHTVQSAIDMASAFELAPTIPFDILISDIGLPDGDGWELVKRLREKRPVKAIAMSGYGMRADLDRSKSAGYAAHIVKPFGPMELDAAVRKALGTSGLDSARW